MREVKAIHPAVRADMDDLVTYRALPIERIGMEALNPFIFLNHHGHQVYPPGNDGLPFGPHPHRGFETVTFILEGELMHQDSGGYKSVIEKGGIQWMTAGRGLIHSELSPESFKERGGDLEILQLWLNLPSRLKMTEPKYVGLRREEIPALEIDRGRVTIHLASGDWDGARRGPVDPLTDVELALIRMSAGGRLRRVLPPGRAVFLYVVRGEVQVNGREATARHLVEFAKSPALAEGEDAIEIDSSAGATLLWGHAPALEESIAAYGPFVMNTEAEIREAIDAFRAGKFGAWKA